MIPSRPRSAVAASRSGPPPVWDSGVPQARPGQREAVEQRASLGVGQADRRAAVEVEDVEDHVDDGDLGRPPAGGLLGEVHALLHPPEAGQAVLVEGDQLAVEDGRPGPEHLAQPAELGKLVGQVVLVAALDPQPAGLVVEQGADAVPLDLDRPRPRRRRRHPAEPGEHRRQVLGEGVGRPGRGVDPMDHPVGAARAEQRVPTGQSAAAELDDDLVGLELLGDVGPAVPDRHRSGAVAPGGNRALEVEVGERMVLRLDRLSVVVGVLGDPVGDRPRAQDAVALEPQVPVQAAGVVLLDDEARLVAARRRGRPAAPACGRSPAWSRSCCSSAIASGDYALSRGRRRNGPRLVAWRERLRAATNPSFPRGGVTWPTDSWTRRWARSRRRSVL